MSEYKGFLGVVICSPLQSMMGESSFLTQSLMVAQFYALLTPYVTCCIREKMSSFSLLVKGG